MGFLHFLPFALLALRTFGEEPVEEVVDNPQSPNLAVKISTSFPSSEIFGIKLVNGQSTQAVFSISNEEPEPVSVRFVGGSLWTSDFTSPSPQGPRIVRNLTTTRYDLEIPAGQSESVQYKFATELQPQELKLNLAVVLTNNVPSSLSYFFVKVLSYAVRPLTNPSSHYSIFLYLFLAGIFGGTCFFIYNTWISTLFPQKRRGGKDASRARKSTSGSKKVDSSDQVSVVGADGPAVTSGSKAYDESWIPAGHLQRPDARRGEIILQISIPLVPLSSRTPNPPRHLHRVLPRHLRHPYLSIVPHRLPHVTTKMLTSLTNSVDLGREAYFDGSPDFICTPTAQFKPRVPLSL
ncbi:MAG: hypothetical protein L6R40_006773 [Gallowayella cf. fulva]|nr:MAG: hypothetical protein L6R40_006773 [Xanthomendoza cf. fulva]